MKKTKLAMLILALVCLLTACFGLTACGENIDFKINFVVDGTIYKTVSTSGGETIKMPENPTKDDYDFGGWFWDKDVWEKPFTANSLLDAPLSSDMSVYAKFTKKHEHSYTAVITAPTCTERGYTTYTCECGDSYIDDYVDTLGHTPDIALEENRVEPKCEVKGGYDLVIYCKTCGTELSREHKEIVALSHDYGEWIETTAPTCTTKGVETRYCSHDHNHTETRPIEELGHSYSAPTYTWSADNKTCTAERICLRDSNHRETETVNTTADIIQNQSCEADELTTYTATFTNSAFVTQTRANIKTKDKLGHEFTNYVSDNNATYDSDGTKTAYCNHGCGAKDTVADIGTKLKSGIAFKTLSVDGNNVSGKVANNVTTYSFLNEITTTGTVTYSVSYDINGNNTIPSKTTNINEGDNIFYVLEKVNGEVTNLFTVNVRRREIYDVTFNANGGTSVASQRIEEDSLATEPTTTRTGYTFTEWDYDFNKPITKNTAITASWKANVDTKYKVEYYLQNITDNNYTLTETDNLTGSTGMQATADIKDYEHFTHTIISNSKESANINGDGTTVLKVYYTRDKYAYSVLNENTKGGTISCTANETYKYETQIELSATVNAGYDFVGWFKSDIKISAELKYSFTLTEKTDVTAKYSAHTAIPYKVEYYLQNLEDDNYSLDHTDNLTGTTDTQAIAEIKTFKHFTHTAISNSKESANINGNGTTVLKVYYTRDKYTVKIQPQDEKIRISTSYNGEFKYGYTIEEITATFNNYLGYEWKGWYSDNEFITSDLVLQSFTVNKPVNYIANSAVKEEMMNFNFSSTKTTCEIAGIKYYTVSEIIIPDYVTSIGDQAFYHCYYLPSVTIGNGVRSIGSYAFYRCSGLTSVTIPDSVTDIGYQAFNSCSRLSTVNWNATNCGCAGSSSSVPIFGNCSKLTTVNFGKNVEIIPDYAFSKCSSLTEITIPDSVTSIRNEAFNGCSSLESVTIGNSVTSIRDWAFGGCSSLTSITIPNSVTSIGKGAFAGCSSLQEITMPFLRYTENGTMHLGYIFGANSCSDNPSRVPSSLKNVVINGGNSIGDYAFFYCSSLTSVKV